MSQEPSFIPFILSLSQRLPQSYVTNKLTVPVVPKIRTHTFATPMILPLPVGCAPGAMDRRFSSTDMRHRQPALQGLFSPFYPTSISIYPRPASRRFSPSLRLYSSSPAAFEQVLFSYPSSNLSLCDSRKLQFRTNDGIKKTPRRLCSPSKASLMSLRSAVENDSRIGLIRSFDSKETLRWYSELLRQCTLNRSMNEGQAIHGQVIKSGIELDSHLWISLINCYTKCGCLDLARRVFDEMPDRDVVAWTVLISGFLAGGCSKEGVSLVCDMYREGIKPNEFTMATALKACSMCKIVEFGKQLHGAIVKGGMFSDVYVGSSLVDLYAKCGEVEYAEKVLLCMPKQNAVSWNALLNGYAQVDDGEGVLRLFCRMEETEMKFNTFTLTTVLKGCASAENLISGLVVHGMAIKIGCETDEFVNCSLVDMYSKCGLADDALKVFLRIEDPDIVTWSAMISCLDQQGRKQKAAELFCSMLHLGLRPNQFTLASSVNAAKDLCDPLYCGSIHACVYKYGYAAENVVCNALITMYMTIGSVCDGLQIFDSLSNRDVVSWNAILSGFHDGESCVQGPRIFNEMLVQGFKPNMYSFISILRSCSSFSNLDFGKQVHSLIIKNRLDEDCYVGTALIDMYAKCGCLEDVEVIFNNLNKRDLFAWTVIIGGYAQADQGEKAVHYLSLMRRDGIKPNEFTLASCLRACSGIGSLENGRQLHSLAIKDGHFADTFVSSALVDMYGKCGSIDDAEIIFKGLDSRDTVLWNIIIFQYAQHGKGEKALLAFDNMLDEGVLPDGVTFIGILSACSHMGLVDLGRYHFHLMGEAYGISPSIEHYACMVDILGRAGKFDEVERFIKEMKLTPNGLIWQTVLGACKAHGNVVLGERAAEKLFEIEPEADSNYILLSNIFAAKGMWDDVARVRTLMSRRGIKKEPGCSWVEVDAQTHVFLSQDVSHPRTVDIYHKLEELGEKLSLVGYVPNTAYVLHNVPDKEKRENLAYHSERLALGFSLINNISHKSIRIFKNLRICGDCHNYMKLISGFVNQDIIIRDNNRFHHFRNGACSCRDYW